MAGLKVGKHIPITKVFEIGGEDVELTFHVLPPNKRMSDEISKYRNKKAEEFEKALEDIFQAEKLFPYVGSWDGLMDANGDPLELNRENFVGLCEMYPTIHGGIVECLYEAAPRKREADRKNSKTSPSGTTQMGEVDTELDTAGNTAPAADLASDTAKH